MVLKAAGLTCLGLIAAMTVVAVVGSGAASAAQYKATVQSAKDMKVTVQGMTMAEGKALIVDGTKGVVVEGMTLAKRRLYCIDPWKHGNVGPNINVERHGPDGLSYSINTGAYSGRGDWSILKEQYSIAPGQAQSGDGKVATVTPPADGKAFSVTISGTTEWKFVRVTPAGRHEETETEGGNATIRFEPSTDPLPAGNWVKILDAYEKAIPKGLTSNGNWNNFRSWFNKDYNNFVCGAYQGRVLAWLDGLKFSQDPRERALIEGYDYGPVEAYYGGHQAVVVYPKGTSWMDTGIVFDPWPNQKPETMSMAEWAMRFSMGSYHGIGGSSPYASQTNPGYPTVGGTYVDPEKMKPYTEEEKKKYARLTQAQRDQLKKVKDPANQRYLARRLMAELDSTGDRVMAHSPVNLYVEDANGRRAGFPGGKPTLEIPGVLIRAYPLEDGTTWTEIEFSRAAGQRLVVEGTGKGVATIADGRGIGGDRPVVEAYRLDAQSGATGTLDLGKAATALQWAGSAVAARSISSADDVMSPGATPPPVPPSGTAATPSAAPPTVTMPPTPTVQPAYPQPTPPAMPPPPIQAAPPAGNDAGGWAPITQ